MFVSYSDDSPAHAKRVLELAQWLRSHGVDAHLDQFEESPEEGWPRWVYTQVRDAELVLVVATPGYLARCEGEVPRAVGADPAVKFESHLSLQELHEAGGRNRKFVPVLFNDDAIVESLPLPLRGATCYRLPAQRDDLYRRLTGQPKVRRAPLGMLKTFDDESLLESTDDYWAEPREPRGRARLTDQRAEDSLRAVIDAGLLAERKLAPDQPGGAPNSQRQPEPGRRWRRSWVHSNRPLLVALVALSVMFMTAGTMMISRHSFSGGSEPACRVQLTDGKGSLVEGIDHVSLELPSGHQIDVIVENGNTLRFACPPVAVQAQAHVYFGDGGRVEPLAMPTLETDNPQSPNDTKRRAARVDGRVALPASARADGGVQQARLVPVNTEPAPPQRGAR